MESYATGTVLVAVSLAALVAFAEREEWAMLVLGLWVVASPWVLGFSPTAAMKIHVGVGLLVAYLAALELWLIHYGRPGGTTS